MKKILLFAATAALFAACTSDEATTPEVAQEAPQAVAFDTYTSAATKAGDPGVQTTATLQGVDKGFGVFAQYSNGNGSTDGTYSKVTNPCNFMWNEHVTYSASAWTYDPLKYWPNETDNDSQGTSYGGTDANGSASSSHADVLSFFAYAPYVANNATHLDGRIAGLTYTNIPSKANSYNAGPGITSFIGNNTTGDDPFVRYVVASKPSESVDLLWGVAPSGGFSYTNVAHATTSVSEGMPLVNLIKPSKDQKIKFLFQHALARLGLTVVAAVDQIAPGGTLDSQTKIAVKSVNITETTASKQLKTSGVLNLKNTAAFTSLWENTVGDIDFTVSNAVGGELNPNIAYYNTAAATWGQASPWTGVTATETDVIANKKYFMVIPGHAKTDLQVKIVYDVITKDDKVNGGYSEVENEITKVVSIPKLTNNKAYNLKLILGLTSVKLDAEVADWEVEGSTEVNLPRNNE